MVKTRSLDTWVLSPLLERSGTRGLEQGGWKPGCHILSPLTTEPMTVRQGTQASVQG